MTGVESNEVTKTYTTNGQLATVTDAEGNKTSYVYDGLDRLSQTQYPSSTQGAGTSNSSDYEQLTYDANGNVTSRRLRDGNSIGYTYDALNRATAKDLPGSEPDVAYTYDLLGRMTSAATSSQTYSFTFDALGRNLTQVGSNGTLTSAYDIAGRRTRLTHPDGFYVDQDYLVTGELQHIRENGATSGVGVLATYAYDDLGRRTSLTRGNGMTTSYGYDAVSRLTSLAHDVSGTAQDVTFGFAYNPAGQIYTRTTSNDAYAWGGHGSGSTTAVPDGLNRFASVGGTSFGYDTKGNLTSDGSNSYSYSSENKLTSLTNPGSLSTATTMKYDPLGRLQQLNSNYSGFWAEMVEDEAGQIVMEYATLSRARRYIFGPGDDEVLVQYFTSPTFNSRTWYIQDERNSVVNTGSDAGTFGTTPNRYGDYGEPQSTNGGRFQYTGQYWLVQPSLLYYKNRFYDPKLGRFLQTDPTGYGAGMNMYGYVSGDPINLTDPSGLAPNHKGGGRAKSEGISPSASPGGASAGIVVTARGIFDRIADMLAMLNAIDLANMMRGTQADNNCATDPSCVAEVDEVVINAYRKKKINDKKIIFLPWPQETAWYIYPDLSFVEAVVTSVTDKCGQARTTSGPARPGYVAVDHAHSYAAPGWPGTGDFATAARGILVYGMYDDAPNNQSGLWRLGPGDSAPHRLDGDPPRRPDRSTPGSHIPEITPTEQKCR